MRLKAHGASDIGLVRENNEDAWYSSPSEALFIIADGLGGHQSGEIASKEAVEYFVRAFREKRLRDPQEQLVYLGEVATYTNQMIHEVSHSHELLWGMGTTLLALHIVGQRALACHIGDSRLYRFCKHNAHLEQVTSDHLAQYQRNTMWGEQETPFYKGYLTRALGTQGEVVPDLLSFEVSADDLLLLCSDGLSDMVSDEEIKKTLAIPLTIEQKVRMLIALAKENGGIDNITVILIELLDDTP